METMDAVPRCKECSKMYKRNEVNEYGLCPKCLVVKVDIEADKVEALRVIEKQPCNPHELLPEGMKYDVLDQSANVKMIDFTNANKNQEKAQGTVKPGEAIRKRFAEIVGKGLITDTVLHVLTNREETVKTFGIRYAFLREFNSNIPIKEITWVSGNARYSSKPIEIKGKKYLITNDLYSKSLPRFMEWADSVEENKQKDN